MQVYSLDRWVGHLGKPKVVITDEVAYERTREWYGEQSGGERSLHPGQTCVCS